MKKIKLNLLRKHKSVNVNILFLFVKRIIILRIVRIKLMPVIFSKELKPHLLFVHIFLLLNKLKWLQKINPLPLKALLTYSCVKRKFWCQCEPSDYDPPSESVHDQYCTSLCLLLGLSKSRNQTQT